MKIIFNNFFFSENNNILDSFIKYINIAIYRISFNNNNGKYAGFNGVAAGTAQAF